MHSLRNPGPMPALRVIWLAFKETHDLVLLQLKSYSESLLVIGIWKKKKKKELLPEILLCSNPGLEFSTSSEYLPITRQCEKVGKPTLHKVGGPMPPCASLLPPTQQKRWPRSHPLQPGGEEYFSALADYWSEFDARQLLLRRVQGGSCPSPHFNREPMIQTS